MKVYVKKHESYIDTCIKHGDVDAELIDYHKDRISWLAHERLVHLLVFLFTLFGLMVFFTLAMIIGGIWLYFVTVILLVVSVFYCLHYFFLENSIQRWYKLADELERMTKI